MSYVPPHRRSGANVIPQTPPNDITIRNSLVGSGWIASGNGGYLYPAGHPHIHIIVENGDQSLGGGSPYRTITMVAISDGQQHNGGGGTAFFPNQQPQARRATALASVSAEAQTRMAAIAAAVGFNL